jgi:AraC family transcriptional regulator
MPQGSRHQVRFQGAVPVAGLALAFEPSRFNQLVEAAGGRPSSQIVQSVAASPPKIEHLMLALQHESNHPSSHDHFGLECIATVIALALSQHAEALPRSPPKAGPRLAPRQVRAVQLYVAENLGATITLADMAAVARLSPFHFLRAFKQSLGVTPRQYVLDCRMERARTLLMSADLSIMQVGICVGFDHPGHFTRAFRRAVGVPPTQFRRVL